jgi:hypothetical protein
VNGNTNFHWILSVTVVISNLNSCHGREMVFTVIYRSEETCDSSTRDPELGIFIGA